MIRAAILDDEPRGSKLLSQKLLEHDSEVDLQVIFNDPKIAVEQIRNHKIDVLFLDIEMPGMNGFQFLEKLQDFDFEVIFTTAYDTYTLEALRLSAVDYLLKPVTEEDLTSAMHRLKERLLRKKNNVIPKPIGASTWTHKKLPLPTSDGIHLVEKTNIIRLEAMSNYCTFHLVENKKIVISRTLKEYEQILNEPYFIRVNRSAIINLSYVTKYKRGNGGMIEMSDGAEIEVSPQRKEELLSILFQE